MINMSFWHNLKMIVGRTFSFLYIGSRLMARWSKLYQWVYQRPYRNPVKTFVDFKSLVAELRYGKLYQYDGVREFADAIAHPEYSQWVLNNGWAPMGFDCDDHAIYIVNALQKSLREGTFAEHSLQSAKFMTVMWIDGKGKMGGHNVALLEDLTSAGVSFRYMDYGFPSRSRTSREDVLEDIRSLYAGINSQSLGWALHDENLKLLEVYWR
jgi:hypothetical protein